MYTIGQISKMFDIPVSTLRYYDKEGLFPGIERVSGIRKFSEKEIGALRVIECLKMSGLELKSIKQYMEWCGEGNQTLSQRKELFEKQRKQVKEELDRMNNTMDMLNFQCWYYEEAAKDGNTERVSSMLPDDMPEEVRKAYIRSLS